MKKPENKVALITGGSSGMGLATAKKFVKEGAYVFITGRRQQELDKAMAEIGQNVTAIQADVAKKEDLDKVYTQIKSEKGHLDIVFANAGGGKFATLGSITEEHYDEMFNINVKGLLFSVQSVLPLLKDGSSIILNASVVSQKGFPSFSVYNATKAAVRSFARSWANDLKDRKIRVNAISPGAVKTSFFEAAGVSKVEGDAALEATGASSPAGRAGTSEELANAVLFLASDDSSYVNGIELFVDGGLIQV
jgi:NAD(P)-dependent dehydrogenase (short-subunit alcohol dehydrogenase family)